MAGSIRERGEALNDPRRKILLVEDEEPIRSLVEKLLVAAGHSVVSTGDPTAAVELVLSVGSGPRVAELRFREGEIVSAEAGGRSGEEAVLELLSWPEGHFSFAPGAPGPEAPLGSFNQILLDACRRLDETRRGEERSGFGD